MKPTRKLILSAFFTIGSAASALAQGTIVFENATSTGSIYQIGSHLPFGYAAGGTYTVALLWAPGGALGTPQVAFHQIALYGTATGGQTFDGFFADGTPITTPSGQTPGGVGVFEVQGWIGNYTSYAAAIAHGAEVGQTAEFLNLTGNPNPPATPPVNTTGWDGNLLLGDPEPSTLAIAGLGAAGILVVRRRQNRKTSIERM